ncbi:GNAT family N-acetyltransferase [Flavivirga rizhaonensis]|nr:GNAT family N-acetyltransferase [Flavivirga rizhaonensis]
MQNIFLRRVIDQVFKGQITIFNFFNLLDKNGTQLIALIVDQFCLIYSNKFNPKMNEVLSEELEFHRFNRYTFAGNKLVIENLLNSHNSPYTIQKHLSIYRCDKVNPEFEHNTGTCKLADLKDFEELVQLSLYFTEEYDGKREDINEMKSVIASGISEENLYQWSDNDSICAIALVMYREQFGFPEIGHLFTNPKHRNKNYASSLVYKITERILKENNFCMLYTNGQNKASNRTFVKVGYVKTGDYIMCFKEA